MSRIMSARTYGKKARKPLLCGTIPLGELNANISISTVATRSTDSDDPMKEITAKVNTISIHDDHKKDARQCKQEPAAQPPSPLRASQFARPPKRKGRLSIATPIQELQEKSSLRILRWEDVCPMGDHVEKIAEASYAEVYRITNKRGTSIIKAIRLESPIKPQTKAQQKSGLVDEEPHGEEDLKGELEISELVAEIPGFVVYKEKYIVEGKTTPALLETHQSFHRRVKRRDPDRLQFYPSPSRYLADTRFLIVELGDAGMALENLKITTAAQIWDVFLGVSVALARAESLIRFEHRDLHEGNVCVLTVDQPKLKSDKVPYQFGYSGLDITILDYGLSRAEDINSGRRDPVAYDLERDLSLFTSTHAKQCTVYRQMRSYLLKGDRIWLPAKAHNNPYEKCIFGYPISWYQHYPYTNVLWLAYLYQYLTQSFKGNKRELEAFKKETCELWTHLNPESPLEIMSFSSAEDIVEFAAEAGWITEAQLAGKASEEGVSVVGEESILDTRSTRAGDSHLRRSPRKLMQVPVD